MNQPCLARKSATAYILSVGIALICGPLLALLLRDWLVASVKEDLPPPWLIERLMEVETRVRTLEMKENADAKLD